jgi:hypothetical protein
MSDNKILISWSSERVTDDNFLILRKEQEDIIIDMPPRLILNDKWSGYKTLYPSQRVGSKYYTYVGWVTVGSKLLEFYPRNPEKVKAPADMLNYGKLYIIDGVDKLSGLGKLNEVDKSNKLFNTLCTRMIIGHGISCHLDNRAARTPKFDYFSKGV